MWEFPRDPWEHPGFYWERSPLAYVDRVATPLLIIHAEQDLRCPIGEAEQLFAALRKLGKEAVFLRWFADHLGREGRVVSDLEAVETVPVRMGAGPVDGAGDHHAAGGPEQEGAAGGL